jgi:hypothetical protein
MKKRDFKDWQFEQINIEFGYKRHYRNFDLLENWLKAENPITEVESKMLNRLSEKLFLNSETWNEDELKFFFLGPLIDLVDFTNEHYKPFTQRKLSAIIGDWEVSGIADFFISKGIQTPREPYFFLHEYKQEKRRDNDPLGQLLAEMLVAQHDNQETFPIYGCYVVGRLHFFVALIGKEYAVSDALTASSEDIFQIFKMMRYVRQKIEEKLNIS